MTTLSIRFIAGRYHATPWGRHVNEGAVEWPPSPWRILRALVATWKRTLPEQPQDQVEPILRALASPPEFVLPPASTGHTRHYMPWFKKGPNDRTLVFDTFVAVPREAVLLVRWPGVSLTPAQSGILAKILANLNVLGRSESWCDVELLTADKSTSLGETDLKVETRISAPIASLVGPTDSEIVRLLCLDPKEAFSDEHAMITVRKTSARRKSNQGEPQRVAVYDPPWNMCMETLQLHKERWSDPPGSRWVQYLRPRDCLRIAPPSHLRVRTDSKSSAQAIRYALVSHVLPIITDTLPVAEAARRALMSIYGTMNSTTDGQKGRSPTFSGKNEAANPLKGHKHAYYLPADEDGDGRLDHLTVIASSGFGLGERRALDQLRRVHANRKGEESHSLGLLMLSMGGIADCTRGPLALSRVWESATPYLATRYAKTRGQHRVDLRSSEERAAFLIRDLLEQVEWLSPQIVAGSVRIEPVWDSNRVFKIAGRWRPIQFKRFRRKSSDDGGRRLSGSFRIEFPEPIRGPVCLGHSSHFGLGLFLPSPE